MATIDELDQVRADITRTAAVVSALTAYLNRVSPGSDDLTPEDEDNWLDVSTTRLCKLLARESVLSGDGTVASDESEAP